MGIKKFFGGEDKGLDCDIETVDGSVQATCKRVIKQKDGTFASDGQTVVMEANASDDCKIGYSGHLSVLDNDGFNAFDPLAKRLQHGCRRLSKTGLTKPPAKAGN